MDSVRELVISLFAVDSIWSVVLRGGIWLLISMIIIISTDSTKIEQSSAKLKKNLGFLLMFMILSGGMIYLLFGFSVNTVAQAAG
jgi:hypothetical protein